MSVVNNLISMTNINTMVSLAIQTHQTSDQQYMKVAVEQLESFGLTPEQNSAIANILINVPNVENAATLMEREINETLCPKILELSKDVISVIFSHFSVRDLVVCSSSCKSLKQEAQNELLWQHIYNRDFSCLDFRVYPKPVASAFFQAIKDTYQVKANFLGGIYSTKKSLGIDKAFVAHTHHNGILYVSFRDRTIGSFDLKTGEFAEIPNQGSQIDSIVFFEDKLYLGNVNISNEILVYDLKEKKYLSPLKEKSIIDVPLVASGNKLCVSVKYLNIEIWDLNAGELLHKLPVNNKDVQALAAQNEKLCVGYSDGSIDVWDLNEGICLSTLSARTGMLAKLSFTGEKLISLYWDQKICLSDLQTGQSLKEFQIPGGVNFIVCGEVLYAKNLWHRVEIWDLGTGKHLSSFNELQGQHTPLFISDGDLYVKHDSTIRVFDFKADHLSVLKEIADLFRGDKEAALEAMARFSRMPEKVKKKVYEQLQVIPGFPSPERPELANDAFYTQNATQEQAALAIENYIKSQTGS